MNKNRSTPNPLPLEGPQPSQSAPSHAARKDRVVYFFAVLPPDGIRWDIARLRVDTVDRERIACDPAAADRLHVSLARLCDCAPSEVARSLDQITALADVIAARVTMRRFGVCFDQLQTFINVDRETRKRKCLLVLCDEFGLGLHRLHDLLWASFIANGIRIPKAFNPHMTLNYDSRSVVACDVVPYRWTVQDFAFVQSFHGKGRHVILKRWPLIG